MLTVHGNKKVASLGALLLYVYSSGTFIMQSTYRPIYMYVCSVWFALSYLVRSFII